MFGRQRRVLTVSLAALLVSVTGMVSAQADPPVPEPRVQAGDLLLANHGFEDGTASWTPTDGNGGPATAECEDVLTTGTAWASEGEHALTLPGRAPCVTAGAASDAVEAVAGETYTAFAHVGKEGKPKIGLRWIDANGDVIDTTFTTAQRRSEVIEVTGEAPDGAVQVAVEVAARGRAAFDEILITAAYTQLGPQVTKQTSFLSMAAGVDENGRHVTYAMGSGSENDPAVLTITDILTAKVTRTVELPGAVGSWGVRQNPVTKTVYIGTYQSAALWLYTPGEDTAERVGPPPIDSVGFVYDITFDENGVAYGGTWGEPTNGWAGASVFKYEEGKGFQGTLGDGPLVTDANYARPVAYESKTKTVFTGTGTKPHLIGCSTEGEARCKDLISLFSEELQKSIWVYGITASDGYVMAWAGDSGSQGKDSLVVLKVSRDAAGELQASVVKEIKGVIYNGSSPVIDNKIYYNVAGEEGLPLHSFDVESGEEATIADAPVDIFSRRWEAVQLDDPEWPGTTIVGWNSGAILVKYNLETKKMVRTVVEDVPEVSTRVNSVVTGDDGRVWSAGYLTGGLAAESSMRGDLHTSQAVGGQAEGMINYKGRVYQGTYPNGRIESFTAAEIAAGDRPRVDCTIGAKQNRPYGLAGHGDRVYYGSQAEYGHDMGAFGWLDLKTGECTTLEGSIGNQAVNTIAASGDKVFGGGSIFYSYDGTPVDDQAKMLIFDESTQKAKTITWPVPGTRSVNASVTDAEGNVWFYAEGWLLAIDPETEEWIHREEIFPDWKPGARIGGSYGQMINGTDGRIFGNVGGRVFEFDPRTALKDGSADKDLAILFQGAGPHLTIDAYGTLHVPYNSTRLLRINPR